jgi:hypothetical protein
LDSKAALSREEFAFSAPFLFPEITDSLQRGIVT